MLENLFPLIFLAFLYFKIRKYFKKSNGAAENLDSMDQGQALDLQSLIKNAVQIKESKHVHSKSDYNNKNYIPNKPTPVKFTGEESVKRSVFDNRGSQETVSRKNYD
jgi:hypothetical protein